MRTIYAWDSDFWTWSPQLFSRQLMVCSRSSHAQRISSAYHGHPWACWVIPRVESPRIFSIRSGFSCRRPTCRILTWMSSVFVGSSWLTIFLDEAGPISEKRRQVSSYRWVYEVLWSRLTFSSFPPKINSVDTDTCSQFFMQASSLRFFPSKPVKTVGTALLASSCAIRAILASPWAIAFSCSSFRAQVSPFIPFADSPLRFYSALLA